MKSLELAIDQQYKDANVRKQAKMVLKEKFVGRHHKAAYPQSPREANKHVKKYVFSCFQSFEIFL